MANVTVTKFVPPAPETTYTVAFEDLSAREVSALRKILSAVDGDVREFAAGLASKIQNQSGTTGVWYSGLFVRTRAYINSK